MRRRDAIVGMAALASGGARSLAADKPSGWNLPTFGAVSATLQPGELGPLSPWGLQVREYVVRTTDGWKLVLRRHWMPDRFSALPPVVLCHGLGANGRIFELTAQISLADYLAGSGLDAWVVDLRGSGKSEKWVADVKTQGAFSWNRVAGGAIPSHGFATTDVRKSKWTFDDHVDHDVPAILEFVKHVTNKGQVSWLGICLGADVALAHLGKYNGNPSIGRLATIGGQVTMAPSDALPSVLEDLVAERDFQLARQPRAMDDALSRLEGFLYERSNLSAQTLERFIDQGRESPSTGVLAQVLMLCKIGRLIDSRHSVDYSGRLRMIRCPCAFITGVRDSLAGIETQQILMEAVGASDKTMLRLGKEAGLSTDYGRGDVLLGEASRSEIYPLLTRWLRGDGLGQRTNRPLPPAPPSSRPAS